MNKALNKSFGLGLITLIAIGQVACSTPGGTTTNTNNNNTGTQSAVKVIAKQNTLLLTQKSANGDINPVVPEDLESLTVNGKVYKASDITIVKGGLSTKATDFFLKFQDGRFIIDGTDGDVQLNISFKLKDSPNTVVLPDLALLALTGELRVEFTKNDKGEIIGVKGGFNSNGTLDPAKPMFRFDPATGKLDVIANGQLTTYTLELADVKTELKIKTDPVQTTLSTDQLKTEQDNTNVDKPSAGAAFVGKWKYDLFGNGIRLTLREGSASTLNYSASISSIPQNFKGDFSGSVKYSSAGENTLNIESMVTGKGKINGKIQLVGDNSLSFTLVSSEVSEIKSFVGQSLSLVRDIN
jgi:hypothetical protein